MRHQSSAHVDKHLAYMDGTFIKLHSYGLFLQPMHQFSETRGDLPMLG